MFEQVVPAGGSLQKSSRVRPALIKVAITLALVYQAFRIHAVTGELTRREQLLNERSRILAEKERDQLKRMEAFKQRLNRGGIADEASDEKTLSESSGRDWIAPIQPREAARAGHRTPRLGADL